MSEYIKNCVGEKSRKKKKEERVNTCCKEERGRSKMEVEEKQAYVSAWQW
jgi:hypothetical protein